ncbi:MaoC/PaaZ C-terminal domain-containing protein [Serratia rhizosphaerae]
MRFNYTRSDAEQWAAFSGDYNPIHFDLQWARKIGSERLTVHGMRAMLDMKQALSESLRPASPDAHFFRFSARLRQPVRCELDYRLDVATTEHQASGRLLDECNDECCFSAKLIPSAAFDITDAPLVQRLERQEVEMLRRRFPGTPEAALLQWSFLDALLFQRIVSSTEILSAIKERLPTMQAQTLIDVFAQLSVVQTHHDVHFHASLFMPGALGCVESVLHYAILPPLIVGDGDSGLVVQIEVQCWTPQGPLLATAVTLKTASYTQR